MQSPFLQELTPQNEIIEYRVIEILQKELKIVVVFFFENF